MHFQHRGRDYAVPKRYCAWEINHAFKVFAGHSNHHRHFRSRSRVGACQNQRARFHRSDTALPPRFLLDAISGATCR